MVDIWPAGRSAAHSRHLEANAYGKPWAWEQGYPTGTLDSSSLE